MAHRFDIGVKERRLFLLMVWFYLSFRLMNSLLIGPELIRFYGSDFLFIPILMTSIKIIRSLFQFSFDVNTKEVVIAVVYASVVFEWLLPKQGTNFVSDLYDILAYCLGAIFYLTFVQSDRILRKKKTLSP